MNIFRPQCFLIINKQAGGFCMVIWLIWSILLSQCYLLQVTEGKVLGKFSQDFVRFIRLLILDSKK